MKCRTAQARLSDYMDGGTSPSETQAVRSHLEACADCARRHRDLQEALAALRAAPRLVSRESIAAAVLNRLEVENRGPGLALLFRPAWKARPLIYPSLVPAALILLSILAGVLALDGEPRQAVMMAGPSTPWVVAPSGTEANPLFMSKSVTSPRLRKSVDLDGDLWAAKDEESLFLETVVARDGSVSNVTVLSGDSIRTAALVKILRQERFEPARFRGRPVAVSLYRLISRVEVRASLT
ncbi:MAG: zf-HC2 domain-containing protein [Vicinamibacteria bacterium]|nr:zf-HC2 domain-containing protein [Vicinamibacteria bacterium]